MVLDDRKHYATQTDVQEDYNALPEGRWGGIFQKSKRLTVLQVRR